MSDIPVLPNDILIEIFKLLPLLDLFKSIGPVCRHWRVLVFQHELFTRKTLVLFPTLDKFERSHCIPEDKYHHPMLENVKKDDGSPWVQKLSTEGQIRFNLMPMRHFTSDGMIERNIMPNITHLTLFDHSSTTHWNIDTYCEDIIRLIRRWSRNLISLKLDLYIGRPYSGGDEHKEKLSMMVPFFKALNKMPSLRHLDLKLNCSVSVLFNENNNTVRYAYISLPSRLRFSFLSHLHTFCFDVEGVGCFDKRLLASLRQFDTGNGNLKICAHKMWHNKLTNSLDKALLLEPQLANKFTRILKGIYINEYEQLSQPFSTAFTSLTSLSLNIREPYMMRKLSQELQFLSNLVCLKLDYRDIWQQTEWEDPSDQPLVDYCQVASVRLLFVHINTSSHCDIAKLSIPVMFPNVQVLVLKHGSLSCTICGYREPLASTNLGSKLARKINKCRDMGRKALQACAKLHTFPADDVTSNSNANSDFDSDSNSDSDSDSDSNSELYDSPPVTGGVQDDRNLDLSEGARN